MWLNSRLDIHEDVNEFQKLLATVKLASEMSDSEIIYFMRKSEIWTMKIQELVADNRKFQEGAFSHEELTNGRIVQ